jgi:kumamolisin
LLRHPKYFLPQLQKILAMSSNLSSGYAPFQPSARRQPTGSIVGNVNANEVIEVSVRLRRKADIQSFLHHRPSPISQNEYADRFGASEEDIETVIAFAHEHDLTVVTSSVPRRTVTLRGSVFAFTNAFNTSLANYQHPDGCVYRGRTGTIELPTALQDIVIGVFGLDNRPQARPMFHVKKKDGHFAQPKQHAANVALAADASFYANDVAKAYQYPTSVTGAGECIALIELGGGYRTTDMKKYFKQLGLSVPVIRSKSVDNGHNNPTTADSADGEVALDIEVAAAVAPGAKIVVYFAPNTDKGFLDAITTALHDKTNKPSVISISWGSAEAAWTSQALQNFNEAFQSAAALGVTITVAAGDSGSADGETDGKAHVDFPASSPWVLACGGTRLTSSSETVWNDGDGWATGGGISDVFDVPDYQSTVKLPADVNGKSRKGRGVPDIAANADSNTGYNILVDGQWSVIGGTSAVAPLMAGLVALANQHLKRKVGFINPQLYKAPHSSLKDIVSGNNNTAKAGGYTAGAGWDACSGLGAPLGALVDAL